MARTASDSGSGGPDSASGIGGRMRLALGLVGLGVLATALMVAGFVVARAAFYRTPEPGIIRTYSVPTAEATTSVAASATVFAASPTASSVDGKIEVPHLVGMRADEAIALLQSAGLAVVIRAVGTGVASETSRGVVSQDPSAGTVVSAASTVTIVAPPLASGAATEGPSGVRAAKSAFVVCIDPGHQAHSDSKLEPLGPDSKAMVPRATGGATGVSTGLPEYESALQISINLEQRLEAAGIKVVMTRTTNDVQLSNVDRAQIADRAKADVFVRVHDAGSVNPADSGVTTLFPAKNQWTKSFSASSRVAAGDIQAAVVRRTGASDRGVLPATGLAGFNWAKMPTVLVETGFLSNQVEDRLLASPRYQDHLAQGLAEGIMTFLNGSKH